MACSCWEAVGTAAVVAAEMEHEALAAVAKVERPAGAFGWREAVEASTWRVPEVAEVGDAAC